MNKCLVLSRPNATEKHTMGVWILVDKSDEDATIKALGDKFIFSFEFNEVEDSQFLQSF